MKTERYYFKTTGNELDETCVEPCLLKNDGTMIGSVKCQECKNCTEVEEGKFLHGPSWIKCSALELAIGQAVESLQTVNK